MKDRESIEKWTHDRPFGTGIIDNVAILDEVRKHGFAGNVTIEYEHNWKTNLPEIAQCAGYLRAYSKIARADHPSHNRDAQRFGGGPGFRFLLALALAGGEHQCPAMKPRPGTRAGGPARSRR